MTLKIEDIRDEIKYLIQSGFRDEAKITYMYPMAPFGKDELALLKAGIYHQNRFQG